MEKKKLFYIFRPNLVRASSIVVGSCVWYVRTHTNNRTVRARKISNTSETSSQLSRVNAHLTHSEKAEGPASSGHVSTEETVSRLRDKMPSGRVLNKLSHTQVQ